MENRNLNIRILMCLVTLLFSVSSAFANFDFLQVNNYFEYKVKISNVEFRICAFVEKDTIIKGNKYFKFIIPNDPGRGYQAYFFNVDTNENALYKYSPQCALADKKGKLLIFNFNPGNQWTYCEWGQKFTSQFVKSEKTVSKIHIAEKLQFVYTIDTANSKEKIRIEKCFSEKLGLRKLYCSNFSPFGKLSYSIELEGAIIQNVHYGEIILKNNYSLRIPDTYNFEIFPNPFNPKTIIRVNLLSSSVLKIVIYNMAGVEIATLQNGYLSDGVYSFEFDGSELSSGIYYCNYSDENSKVCLTKRMVLIK